MHMWHLPVAAKRLEIDHLQFQLESHNTDSSVAPITEKEDSSGDYAR